LLAIFRELLRLNHTFSIFEKIFEKLILFFV